MKESKKQKQKDRPPMVSGVMAELLEPSFAELRARPQGKKADDETSTHRPER